MSEIDYSLVGMTMDEYEEALADAYLAAYEGNYEPPAYMGWGPPGIGKTFKIYAAAKRVAAALREKGELGADEQIEVRSIMMSCIEPTDIVGVPFSAENGPYTEYKPLDWAYHASTLYADKIGREVPMFLFFDDFPVAHEQVQAAGYKFFHERMAGKLKLHNRVYLLAAGNRPEDNAAAQSMPTAMASRFRHVYCKLDTDQWVKWARQAMIHPLVSAFIFGHKECLHEFDPNSTEHGFPCPRTWEMVSRLLMELNGFTHSRFMRSCMGIIGMGMTTQFQAFCEQSKSAVPVERILENPETAPVPDVEELDSLHATIMSLEHYVKTHPEVWEKAGRYALRKEMIPEMGLLLCNGVNSIILANKELHESFDSPVYMELLDKFSEGMTV